MNKYMIIKKIPEINSSNIEKKEQPIEQPIKARMEKDIELSKEQQYAYYKFMNGENLFITGPGGTGKTRLIKKLVENAKKNEKNVSVCAMTGCAAILLNCNARTLHSWSGIKLAKGTKQSVINSVLKNKRIVKIWKKVEILILDEVSMLSKKVFEIIEEIARCTRLSSLPFGGIQVIFTGDFYQLPPVGSDGEPETEQFCFESPRWNMVFTQKNHIQLETIFRQTDLTYIEILKQIRQGTIEEKNVELLRTFINREYNTEKNNGCIPTKLFPIRSKVDYVNNMMFSKLNEQEHILNAIYKTDFMTYVESEKNLSIETIQQCSRLSVLEKEQELDLLMNSIPCNKVLRLKKGAIVMCTINLDMYNSICNGSQGVVIDIIEGESMYKQIVVRFSNGIIKKIQPNFWQCEDFPTLGIGQYPLCLAWALTIHKIQGATLSMAEIDIGQSIFEYGQTYVALSRIQSLEGLYLSAFNPTKIKTNPKVTEFYKNIPKFELSELEKIETSKSESINNSSKEASKELKEESYDSDNIKKIKF
uniref:AAA+ ATPase domain-containing protein n=1 Tax=viral metagenome TaxID=1070528 RepID=A0A6C0DNN2_9ZZZZ